MNVKSLDKANFKRRIDSLKKYYLSPSFCLNCKTLIEVSPNDKTYEIKKRKFCNHSCAAIYANHKHPKRKKQVKICPQCKKVNQSIHAVKGKICRNCYYINIRKELENCTDRTFPRNKINKHAQAIYRESGQLHKCQVCGYDFAIQICHIKPVKQFPKNTPYKTINKLSNLIALCRNCHWEFDHLNMHQDLKTL